MTIRCPRCRAPRKEWCTTVKGGYPLDLHPERVFAAKTRSRGLGQPT